METSVKQNEVQFISEANFLEHWLGHRGLTRRVIEAFPEKELFTHSIGGMRTFADMTMELLAIAGPGIQEIATGKTEALDEKVAHGNSKETLLDLWDKATEQVVTYWEEIQPTRFPETIVAFGQYEGTVYSTILYYIDNEIHHRAQGYVYLRALGIEPPFFYER